MSLLMWERGLKLVQTHNIGCNEEVTPYVGVWIETAKGGLTELTLSVTPYVGVWIETSPIHLSQYIVLVTPYVGVWIET